MFTIELPAGRYAGTPEMNAAAELTSTDRTLVAVKDPWGLAKPCASDTASIDKAPVRPERRRLRRLPADASPGVTVAPEELTIDGHRVVHATISTDCERSTVPPASVAMWTPKASTSHDPVGRDSQVDSASVYLAEVGSDLVLLQWQGDGITSQEERDVLSTITFLDGLPPAP